MAARVAGGLRAAGVRRGDVVAWQLAELARGRAAVPRLLAARRGRRADPPPRRAQPRSSTMLATRRPARGSRRRRASVDALLAARRARRCTELGGPARATSRSCCSRRARPGHPKAALHTQRGLAYKAALMVGGARARAATTRCSCPRRSPTSPACSTACSLPGARPACGAVLMARWDPEHALGVDRARADHVHDRAAHVLRRAHGRARLHARAGRVAAARLERRRRRDARVRRRGVATRSAPG